MSATRNRDNLTIGAADLHSAPAGEALPATIDDEPAGNWASVGYTDAATTLEVAQEFAEKRVQQSQMVVKRTRTGLDVSVTAVLAEATLANIKLALSGAGTITSTAAGTGTPGTDQLTVGASEDADEFALLIDGVGPSGFRRRVYLPNCSVTSTVSLSQDKDDYALVEVTFSANDAGAGIKPLDITDKTADAQ